MDKITTEFIEIVYNNLFDKEIEGITIYEAFEQIKEKIFNVRGDKL